jgi:hypothetical protein
MLRKAEALDHRSAPDHEAAQDGGQVKAAVASTTTTCTGVR